MIHGILALVGRALLCGIFFMSAVMNKIPHFEQVAGYMGSVGMPMPQLLLFGAIVFLLAGSASVVVGYFTRVGAGMLLVFLVLATYYFHAFWTIDPTDTQAVANQMAHFMKNVALMGAMVFLIGNGPGPMSLDGRKD